MKITLLTLIEAWVKSRGLPWQCDPENSKLLIKGANNLDISINVEKDRVVCTPMTFCDEPQKIDIVAIDPAFFSKLENVMRIEERWSNCAKCIVLLGKGLMNAWGPMLSVVVPWLLNRLDDIFGWGGRRLDEILEWRQKYFPRQEL